jgi:hypothetical protein
MSGFIGHTDPQKILARLHWKGSGSKYLHVENITSRMHDPADHVNICTH